MTWLRLDDQIAFHEKTVAAGNAAFGAWVRLAAWSSAQLTDGKVPAGIARTMARQRELDRLVGVGLLDGSEDGYEIHDFLRYNPSRDQVLTEREKGKKRAAASYERRSSSPEEDPKVERSFADSSASLRPTRPDPTRPDPRERESAHPREVRKEPGTPQTVTPLPRETIVTLTLAITPEWTEIARGCAVQDIAGAWKKFTGYQNGRSIDVAGRWQSWCAREAADERTRRERIRSHGSRFPLEQEKPKPIVVTPEDAAAMEREYQDAVRERNSGPTVVQAVSGAKRP